MWAVVVRRIAAMLFAILFLTALVFFLMHAVLGDPVVLMLGQDADPATIARLRQDLGFNRPAYVQYTDWLGRLSSRRLGSVVSTGQPVLEAILARLPVSLELGFLSLLLALALALGLGILAAVRRHTTTDVSIGVLTAVGTAMPNFWSAILLILVFARTSASCPQRAPFRSPWIR